MRLGKGGQMFGGCHSGGGARGQGGAMQVWLQLGCPWAGHRGHATQRGALQCCPVLQQEGGEVVPGQREAVPGMSLSWGKPCRAETTTQEGSAGEGLEGLTGTSAYPLHALQHQGLSGPHLLLPQTPWHAHPPPCCVLQTGLSPRARSKQRGQAKGPGSCSDAGAEAGPVASLGANGVAGPGSGVGEAGACAHHTQCRSPSPCERWGGGWQGAAPQSQSCLAGEVLEDSLVRVVMAVVVVGQDARVVGALHVPAQCLTGALWGWQSIGWVQTPCTLPPPESSHPAQPVHKSFHGSTQLPASLGLP